MATDSQGIMALPENDQLQQPQAPQMSMYEAHDAAKAGVTDADPKLTAMYDEQMSQVMPQLIQLTDEQLDSLMQLIQYLQTHPEEYSARVKELADDGMIDPSTFPMEYDENFLALFATALIEAQKSNGPGPEAQGPVPPATMARGGIAEAARMVANQGRSGDSILAHISPREARMLRKKGGAGTINPRTGFPEYGWWESIKKGASDAWNGAVGAVTSVVTGITSTIKNVLASPIGRIAATIALATMIGPTAFSLQGAVGVAAQYGLASAGVTALSGGNVSQILQSGVTGAVLGYGGAVLGPAIGSSVNVTSAAGQAALGAGAASTGVALATGSNIKDALQQGITSAAMAGTVTGLDKGFSTPATAQAAAVGGKGDVMDVANVNQNTGAVNNTPSQWTDASGNQIRPDAAKFDTLMDNATGPSLGGSDGSGTAYSQLRVNGAPPPANGAPPPAETGIWDTTKNLYKEYLSPSGIQQQGTADAIDAKNTAVAEYTASHPNASAADITKFGDAAYKAALPGVMSTYGPMVGAGLLAAGAMGGFEPKEVPGGTNGAVANNMSARLAAGQADVTNNPGKYTPQGMEKFGLIYNDKGEIVGSQPWNPAAATGPTEVASTAIPYTPARPTGGIANLQPPQIPLYTPPSGAIGTQRQIPQPYNTPRMYDFMGRPVYAAAGGIMNGAFPGTPLGGDMGPTMADGIASLAVGGYPRRNGQIDGPGTETSDSIPAMLSDGEFVMTAKAVRSAGKGNRRAGAKKMYALMHQLEKNAARG
tara:strand:- start:10009 stop:12309 length:2301 start_codon:yes stop_codon:yes gene_type:complete